MLKINQKHYKQNLPLGIGELFGISIANVKHRYSMKNRSIPNILKHSNDLYNKSFLCKSIIVGQNCVETLRRCELLNILKSNYYAQKCHVHQTIGYSIKKILRRNN